MKVKVVGNFHVFVPGEERDKKIAFTAGQVVDQHDVPEGQSLRDWVNKGLAETVGAAADVGEEEAGTAV